MAKAQPKVSELVEILLQQVAVLEKSVNQNNQTQMLLSKKIENIIIKVNVSELRTLEQTYRGNLQNDFNGFHQQMEKNNVELLKVHKNVSSKRLFYLIFLNIFLILSTGTAVYIAIKKSVLKADFELLVQENNKLQDNLNNVKLFFNENPKATKQYKNWNKSK